MTLNTNNTPETETVVEDRPNEDSGIYIRNFLKITDPKSGEVIVETAG